MSEKEFTTNDDVDKFTHGQKNVQMIGYVDKVVAAERVGIWGRLLKKFVINNGNGKQIPCLVWGMYVNTVAKDVEENKIIHLNAVTALKRSEKNLNLGNTPVELIIGKTSTVKVIGDDDDTSTDNKENGASRQGTEDQQDATSEDEASTSDLKMDLDQNNSTLEIRGTKLFDEYQTLFFKSCNSDTERTGTYWIVKLTKSSYGKRDLTIAGRNDTENGRHVDAIFVTWWRSAVAQWQCDYTSVEVYTNNTPCATCARILRTWLIDNRNIKLSIYFAFVYTWSSRPNDGPPDSEYVGRLQELRNLPNRSVRIKKIDTDVLKNLAEYLGIQFKGYPWYDNYLLESQIITD